jgi:dephospho-CoA kinase
MLGLLVVITGGIGSGKSFVMKYLEELGYKTIYTDKIANEVMRSKEFLRATSTYLKRNITIEDIKKEIENNNEFLDFLEHFVHPEVQKIRSEMIDKLLKINNIVFVEIPLFFEKQLKDVISKHCKVFIVSTICGMEKQVLRAKKRNKNLSDKMLNIILSRQTSDANRVAGSDFIIYTYGRKKVKKEVQKLLRSLEDNNE